MESGRLPWVVKLWKTGNFRDSLIHYPFYVYWMLRYRGFIEGKWSDSEGEEGWKVCLPCEPVLEGWTCLVVYWAYPTEGRMKGVTKEAIEKAVKEGRIIDMEPNEQRLGEYEVYQWWLKRYWDFVERVKAKVKELEEVIE